MRRRATASDCVANQRAAKPPASKAVFVNCPFDDGFKPVFRAIIFAIISEMESYIKRKVSTGFYGNATEVIRDAIRRMQADEERAAAFRRAVAEGEAELDRGEGTDYTATQQQGRSR